MNLPRLAVILLLLAWQTCPASPMQSQAVIQEAVTSFVNSHLLADGQYQISPAQLDPRLQLPECTQALEVFTPSGEIKPGRNTLGIRCNSLPNWTIYSAVSIRSFQDVLVLVKPLQRGEAIRADHLSRQNRDTSTLQQGYISDPADVINKQASRNIPAGSVLNKLHYAELNLVKRGERVNIQSGKAGLLISAPGIAMSDGIKGQQINVKNASSHRVIQATVINAGLVSVFF